MSTQTQEDTTILDALDFSPTLPCDHSQHPRHVGDEPAAWAVISLCPFCQRVAHLRLCEPGRRVLVAGIVGCVGCHGTGDWAAWVIACEPIGGAA